MTRITLCAAVAVLLGAVASAAGAGTARSSTLRADVGEWSIVPSSGLLAAGPVRIEVRNLGASVHRIVLVRTASFGERLPIRNARAAVRPLEETGLLRAGGTASFVVTLTRGSYLLLDNLPWHYWKGTSVAFSVR